MTNSKEKKKINWGLTEIREYRVQKDPLWKIELRSVSLARESERNRELRRERDDKLDKRLALASRRGKKRIGDMSWSGVVNYQLEQRFKHNYNINSHVNVNVNVTINPQLRKYGLVCKTRI